MINLLLLSCDNIHVSKDFYERLLDVEFTTEEYPDSPYHFSYQEGDFTLELYPSCMTDSNGRIGFTVTDINKSIENIDPRTLSSYEKDNKKIYVTVDPDGRRVEIVEGEMTFERFKNVYASQLKKFEEHDDNPLNYNEGAEELYALYIELNNAHNFHSKIEYLGLGKNRIR